MKVKVCGMTREEDVRLAAELGAWAVGLVLVPSSPRALTREKAAKLRQAVPEGVLAVGVFSDAPRAEVLEAAKRLKLDAVQLHGSESPAYCEGFPVPVFKAVSESLKGYHVAGILIEPVRTEEDRRSGRRPGPEAQRAAWAAAAGLKGKEKLVILAGGLDAENVAEAVEIAGPDAVDVSSGVEKSLGVKDPVKLRAFFAALKGL